MVFKPRDYQEPAINAVVDVLSRKSNTLLAMATGAGKTVCMGFIEKQLKGKKTLVIQNREELVNQNLQTIKSVTMKECTIVKASVNDFSGDIVFASTQSLIKENRLNIMPIWDNIFVDECHLMGYESIIQRAREENRDVKVLGCTATPHWDKGQDIFDNVAYAIEIPELVQKGMLKKPVAKVCSLGIEEELSKVKIKGKEYDQNEVGEIVNKPVHNEAVYKTWLEECGNKNSIFFCPTVAHCEELCQLFKDKGVLCEAVHGKTKNTKKQPLRKQYIEDFKSGKIQCLFSVMALTAGFDAPICDCAVMLRTFLSKNNFIQAVGRALRLFDGSPEATILDFTGCCPLHGDIDTPFKLFKPVTQISSVTDMKLCPVCNSELHVNVSCCPFCGFDWNVEIDEKFEEYADVIGLKEFNLLRESRFEWRDMTKPCDLIMCKSKEVTSFIVKKNDYWIGVCLNDSLFKHLYTGSREACIKICDNFMLAKYKKYSGVKNYKGKYMEPADYNFSKLNKLGVNYNYEIVGEPKFDFRIHQRNKKIKAGIRRGTVESPYKADRKFYLLNGVALDDYMAELIISWFNFRETVNKVVDKA